MCAHIKFISLLLVAELLMIFFLFIVKFIHDFNDVLSMPHQPSILVDGYQIEIILSLSVIIASDQMKTIERPRRKCFFFSESILTYFDVNISVN